jgi:hypothetical protein
MSFLSNIRLDSDHKTVYSILFLTVSIVKFSVIVHNYIHIKDSISKKFPSMIHWKSEYTSTNRENHLNMFLLIFNEIYANKD